MGPQVLKVVGALSIAFSILFFLGAKSNIHEIYSAILFSSGVIEFALAMTMERISEAAALVSASISQEAAETRRTAGLVRCSVCHAENSLGAPKCSKCGHELRS